MTAAVLAFATLTPLIAANIAADHETQITE